MDHTGSCWSWHAQGVTPLTLDDYMLWMSSLANFPGMTSILTHTILSPPDREFYEVVPQPQTLVIHWLDKESYLSQITEEQFAIEMGLIARPTRDIRKG